MSLFLKLYICDNKKKNKNVYINIKYNFIEYNSYNTRSSKKQ